VAFSSDGKRIVSVSSGSMVKVWNARTGQALLTFKGYLDGVSSVAVSRGCHCIVIGGLDGTVKVWDVPTGKNLLTLKGHTKTIESVAVSPDGSRIVSAGNDGTVKVWDARTSKAVLTLKGHTGWVGGVTFSGDGKRILGEDEKRKVLAWDAGSGQLLPDAPSRMPARDDGTAASADGRLHVSIEGRLIRVRRADLEQARKQRQARDRERLAQMARFDPSWHHTQLDEALEAGDDFAAAFHLGRLLRAQPWDASLHVHQAHVLARLGKREQSATHLMQALLLNPRVSLWPIDPRALQRGEKAAQAGDWPRAVREFRIAAHQPQASVNLYSLLLAQCAAADTVGVRQTVAEMARRVADEKNVEVADSLFFYASVAPWDRAAAGPLLAYSRRALRRQRNAYTLHCHGCALYRDGKYAEAEQTLAESVKAQGQGGYVDTWLFQAMAVRQRGKHDQARALMARVEAYHSKRKFDKWRTRVIWDTLLAEARKLIDTPPPMRKVGPDE
jgi:Flp pilus assembly protein TadD